MDRHLRGIDHVLVAVRDLERAAERWQDLGFVLTPPGVHPHWGTANRCIMLENSYIELIGFTGAHPRRRPELEAFLAEQGEGLCGLALATDDAAATLEAWRSLGFSPQGPEELSRTLPEGEALAFLTVPLPPEQCLGLWLFACQHRTPKALRRPEWLQHPNGCRRLVSVTLHADPPEEAEELFERLLGTATESRTDTVTGFHLDRTSLLVMPTEDVQLLHPTVRAEEGSARPRLVALQLEAGDPERLKEALGGRAAGLRALAQGFALAPEEATGAVLEFACR